VTETLLGKQFIDGGHTELNPKPHNQRPCILPVQIIVIAIWVTSFYVLCLAFEDKLSTL